MSFIQNMCKGDIKLLMQTTETQVIPFKKSSARLWWKVSSVALAVSLGRARYCSNCWWNCEQGMWGKEKAIWRRSSYTLTEALLAWSWETLERYFGSSNAWMSREPLPWIQKVGVVIILKCCSYGTLCPYKTVSLGQHWALAGIFFGNEKYSLAYHHQQILASALHLIY